MRVNEQELPSGGPAGESSDVWARTLLDVIAELERLNGDTEAAFLTVGGKLAAFIETVNVMSSGLDALAELISGGRGAAQALSSVLDLCRGFRTRAGENNRLLGGIRDKGKRLQWTLSQFDNALSAFQSLGLLSGIETARVGKASADLGRLSEDVRLLAREVEMGVESALGTAGELPAFVEQALESLASLDEVQHLTRDASVRLGSKSGEISGAFQRLIVSMQFQDITRQQLEHVIGVLRRLSSEPRGASAATSVVLELQSLQLSNARDTFSDSVETVARSLDEIATYVVKMADESRALGAQAGTNSFFHQMERGCSAILASLSQCVSADAATRALSEGLADKIDRMRSSFEEIQAIEAQMRLTAMNAMLQMEHLEQRGEAPATRADSIRHRVGESRRSSEALREALDSMKESANRLSGRMAVNLPGEAEGWKALQSAVEQLRSSRASSFSQIADIAAHADRLCRDLAEARLGLSVGAVFVESVSRAQSKLKAVTDEMSCGLSSESEVALRMGLAEFAVRYTMQEQHEIHALVTQNMSEDKAPAAAPELTAEDGAEFGENVELF